MHKALSLQVTKGQGVEAKIFYQNRGQWSSRPRPRFFVQEHFLRSRTISRITASCAVSCNFLCGHLLAVEASGPDVDLATVTCRSSPTSPAQQSTTTPQDPAPGSSSQASVHAYNQSTMPLGVSETDWGGDPPLDRERETEKTAELPNQPWQAFTM